MAGFHCIVISSANSECSTYDVESQRHLDRHPDHNPTPRSCDNESRTYRSMTQGVYHSHSFQSTRVLVGWSWWRKTNTSCYVQTRSHCNSTWCILRH